MEITTSTSGNIEEGDFIAVKINNSFWKILWYWVIRKPLKRYEKYEVTNITGTTLTIDG